MRMQDSQSNVLLERASSKEQPDARNIRTVSTETRLKLAELALAVLSLAGKSDTSENKILLLEQIVNSETVR